MARTVNEIHQGILDSIAADAVLNAKLNSTSKTAIYRLFSYVIAVAIWLHEILFDEHNDEVNALLSAKATHNLTWYANKAKEFQYGDALAEDMDYYDVIDETKQIISNSAVTENVGHLIMKTAKLNGDELAALTTAEHDAFQQFMEDVKDAGVIIDYISQVGDDLRLVMDIWYNPLVLDANGKLLSDSEVEPAKDTVKEFIKNLPFNGKFILVELVDALQATNGIDIPTILSAESKFGANDYAIIDAQIIPEAGYLVIDDADLTINYRANV